MPDVLLEILPRLSPDLEVQNCWQDSTSIAERMTLIFPFWLLSKIIVFFYSEAVELHSARSIDDGKEANF